MARGFYRKDGIERTAEIPDRWLQGATHGIQKREGLSFPDAMMEAVKRWFEQEELEEKFQTERTQ